MERPPEPNELWIVSWILANTPWLFAGAVGGVVRAIWLVYKGEEPFRRVATEALLVAICMAGAGSLFKLSGVSEEYAMAAGIACGLAGPEFIRTDLIERFKRAFKAFGGGDSNK